MRRRSRRCSRPCRRGATLVEAVLGTALLGSLLVALLVGAARLEAARGRADRTAEAVGLADDLLAAWWADPADWPRAGEGTVPGAPGWRWRTRRREDAAARRLEAEVVEVTLIGPREPHEPVDGRSALMVAVVLPRPDLETRDTGGPEADGPARTDAH